MAIKPFILEEEEIQEGEMTRKTRQGGRTGEALHSRHVKQSDDRTKMNSQADETKDAFKGFVAVGWAILVVSVPGNQDTL